MSSAQIREELHQYINKADDRLLNLIYALVQADLQESEYELTNDHKKIIDDRLVAHQSSPESGSSWEEARSRIKKHL